jgi:hypothetical protein
MSKILEIVGSKVLSLKDAMIKNSQLINENNI